MQACVQGVNFSSSICDVIKKTAETSNQREVVVVLNIHVTMRAG